MTNTDQDEQVASSGDSSGLSYDTLDLIMLKSSENHALNEWCAYIEQADMLYAHLRAHTKSLLFQKTFEAWSDWPSLKKAQKVEILMLLSEITARIFRVAKPRIYSKKTWKMELFEHDFPNYEESQGFYYRLESEEPAIVLDDHFFDAEDHFGNVFYLLMHEFGHALIDMQALFFLDQLTELHQEAEFVDRASEIPLALFFSLIMQRKFTYESVEINSQMSESDYLQAFQEYKASMEEQAADLFAMKVRDNLWKCMWNVQAAQKNLARYVVFAEELHLLITDVQACGHTIGRTCTEISCINEYSFKWDNSQDFVNDLPRLASLMESVDDDLAQMMMIAEDQRLSFKIQDLIHRNNALTAWSVDLGEATEE